MRLIDDGRYRACVALLAAAALVACGDGASVERADAGARDGSAPPGDLAPSPDLTTAVVDGAASPDLATAPDLAPADTSLLVEPLGNPRLRFGDGGSANYAPTLFPGAPALAGFPISAWYVAQWKKTQYMRPDVLFESSPNAVDPRLGNSRWAFPSSDNQSHVWIWEPPGGPRVFELYGEHGWLDVAGGSNVFLSIDAIDEAFTSMERPVRLQLAAKIARSGVSYTAPGANTDGSVMWQVFTGLIFHFVPPGGGSRVVLFLQVGHADSHNQPGTYRAYGSGGAIYNGRLPGTPSLYGDAPMGALTALDVDVNAYLCDVVSQPFPVAGGSPYSFPAEAHDLANWRFKSLYTGIETQDRLDSATAEPRGSDFVAYQVAGLDVRKRPSAPIAICP